MVELLGLSIHKPLTLCFFFHYGMTTYSFLSFSPSITSPFYPSLHVQICPIGVSTGWIPSCTCCPVWILMGTTAECCCLPIATWDTPLLSLFFRYRRITNINVKIGVCGSWKKKKVSHLLGEKAWKSQSIIRRRKCGRDPLESRVKMEGLQCDQWEVLSSFLVLLCTLWKWEEKRWHSSCLDGCVGLFIGASVWVGVCLLQASKFLSEDWSPTMPFFCDLFCLTYKLNYIS